MFCPGVGFDKGDWSPLATIHSSHVTLKSEENPFGEVTGGWLDMSAPLERLYAAEGEVEEGFPNRQKGVRVQIGNAVEGGARPASYTCFDTPTHAERARGRELWAAVVWRHARHEETQAEAVYHAIIVARVEGMDGKGHVFERLGKVPFSAKNLGECAWMRDGTLVERFTLV
jgi:hypothetical protein